MLGVALAFVWFAAISLALVGCAAIERKARVSLHADRPGFGPRRALWGGGLEWPPGHSMVARALAGGARIVRARTIVSERARGLRFTARAVACIALASGLALVPFAGRLGSGPDALPLVVVDLEHGLVALILFVLLAAIAQVAVGLSESSVFARLACVRLAGRVLALMATFAVVLAPLALDAGSLRIHAIALDQQALFAPLAPLVGLAGAETTGPAAAFAEALRLPAWFVFRQPLTALLFVPVLGLLTRRPLALDPVGGSVRLSAFGHDDDPGELYWARAEERLAAVLGAALFVALFLGAGAIPYLPSERIVAPLVPLFGVGLPALLAAVIEIGVFVVKLALVLALVARAARATPALRDDQWIRIVTRRMLPLAFSNLLLVAAFSLLAEAARRGAA
ncbi:MAG: NADH-quinone oxidoreductase subunit H [Deltaproteobacteria bacterium]|nr:NADH-quinone oxidoreductase subunit H [Deltaproteobacteria bacterium]